jgi:hypothetical protein
VEKCEKCGKVLQPDRVQLFYTFEEFAAWQERGAWVKMHILCDDCLDQLRSQLKT